MSSAIQFLVRWITALRSRSEEGTNHMGLGFKDWTAGDVPTAAEFDGYLQRQTVMVFASTSARDTALSGSLEEGMHAYNSDDDELWYYDGSGWRLVSPTLYGCSLTRATDQTVTAGATDNVDWTAEVYDQGGFVAVTSDTITIPSGLGGVYSITTKFENTSSRVTNFHLKVNGSTVITSDQTTWVGALAASDTVVVEVTAGSGFGDPTVQGSIEMYRIGRI